MQSLKIIIIAVIIYYCYVINQQLSSVSQFLGNDQTVNITIILKYNITSSCTCKFQKLSKNDTTLSFSPPPEEIKNINISIAALNSIKSKKKEKKKNLLNLFLL